MKHFLITLAVIITISAGTWGICYFSGYYDLQSKTITVSDKYTSTNSCGKNSTCTVKRIETSEGEVFKVEDEIMFWHFDSANTYAKLQKGSTCEIKYYGWRVPFLSMFQNIVSTTCNTK